MQYLAVTTTVDAMQSTLDGMEADFKVRQIFPLVNDPRFLIFAERRTAIDPRRRDQHADNALRKAPRINLKDGAR